MTAAPLVEVVLGAEGLTLGYGRRRILRDVRLEIRRGEYWCLVGPNGHGKTTLLHALLGVLSPRCGWIRRAPGLATREARGFVPQVHEHESTLPLTVAEFVLLGLVGIRVSSHERGARLREALERTGIADLERQSFWSLSGGQRQRAVLARSLVRQPRTLFLDEPTHNLDPATEESILELVARERRERGMTVLFVTHDLAIARRYASHVALVHHGAVRTGTRDEILRHDCISEVFGRLIADRVVHGGGIRPTLVDEPDGGEAAG